MTEKKEQPIDSAKLRRRAEDRLGEKTAPLHGTEIEPLKLHHELHVHQSELEMQNDELRQSSYELETALEKYTDLYDFAPVGYFTLDRIGDILSVNLTGASLVGVERSLLVGRSFGFYITDEDRPTFNTFLEKVFTSPAKESCEVELLKEGSAPLSMQVVGVAAVSGQECRIALIDITERKRAERALHESDRRYLALFANKISAISHCRIITDEQGRPVDYLIMKINEAYERIIGIRKEDIEGRTVKEVFPGVENDAFDYIGVFGKVALEGGEIMAETYLEATRQYLSIYANSPMPGEFIVIMNDVTERKETQDALSRLTQEKNIILNNAPIGISITIDRMQVLISRKSEELFQYAKEEMEFQTTRKLYPSDAAYEKFGQESYPVLAQGLVYETEQELIRKDGRHIFVRHIGKAIEPSDMSKGIIWLLQDITERKLSEVALRESEKEFRLLAEAMPQIVWITRPDGGNIYFNQHWQDYTGQTPEQSHGDGWFKPFHPDDRQRAWDAWQNATLHGAVYSLECRLRRADGVYLWWLIRGVPVLDEHGCVSKWFGTCTDINELKQAENDLVLAKTAAESANRTKSEFLANMSHEIRTPMNGVLGMAQLLEMTDPTIEQQEYIKTLKQSGNDLIALINDILDLSKIEAGKITIELSEFNLHQCIKDMVMMQKLAANDKGLSLEVDLAEDVPHLLLGDPQRVRQILLNLMGNAVKFTERGGITISTQLLEQNDATVLIQITVCDTGIGISTEMLDKIFRPFEQGDGSINRKYGGTGLGLSISHRLTELLGGHISADSTKNVGSCFKVTLPFSIVRDTATTPDLTPKPSVNQHGPSLRILYAEDDQTNVKVMASMLRKSGHNMIAVENGKECLKALEQGASDIVLMDIQMPVMNGVEALREIRKKEQGTSRHQPVIALTAYVLHGDEEHFLEEGFDGYVSKPIDTSRLMCEIQRVVGRGSNDAIKCNVAQKLN
jgi:PAS domain S-box-containing protein